jgi:hypothetical protein
MTSSTRKSPIDVAHEVSRRVAALLTPDLLQTNRRPDPDCSARGHCYVPAEALWYLLGAGASPLRPKCAPFQGTTHWWLEYNGVVVDPTSAQLGEHPRRVYDRGRGCGFVTNYPSRRTQILLRRYLAAYPEETLACRALKNHLDSLDAATEPPISFST